MNNFFNLTRFFSLCKREFVEGRSQWLRWWGILTVILFAFFFLATGEIRNSLFFIITAVASAQLIQGISDRQKRVFYLTIPASPMEKLLARYVYVMSLIFIAYPAAVLTAKIGYELFSYFIFQQPFDFNVGYFFPHQESYVRLTIGFFTIQAIFMFGSMVWLKNSFFKTILFNALFLSVMISAIAFLVHNFVSNSDRITTQMNLLEESESWIEYLFYGIHVGMILFFFVLCYFRFKELGIIHKTFPLSWTVRMVLGCYFLLLATILILVGVGLKINYITTINL